MKQAVKIYMRDLMVSLAVYGALLYSVNTYLLKNEVSQGASVVLALLPMVGFLLMIRAVLVFCRTWDEFQKQKAMEAVIIAFALVATGTFSYGFLEGVGLPRLETIFVFPVMMGSLMVSQLFVAWRYK